MLQQQPQQLQRQPGLLQPQGANVQQMTPRIQEPKLYGQTLSSQVDLPQTQAANAGMQQMLTRAGVSNFAQQMQQIGQQLQYLMERLHFAQNQVETQAQAQLRELLQIQQAVAITMQLLQQAQSSANMPSNQIQ